MGTDRKGDIFHSLRTLPDFRVSDIFPLVQHECFRSHVAKLFMNVPKALSYTGRVLFCDRDELVRNKACHPYSVGAESIRDRLVIST